MQNTFESVLFANLSIMRGYLNNQLCAKITICAMNTQTNTCLALDSTTFKENEY